MAFSLIQHGVTPSVTIASNTAASGITGTNSFSSATTAGNLLVALILGQAGTSAITDATATGASFGTWTRAGTLFTQLQGNQMFATCFYVANCNAVAGSTNVTFTLSFTGTQVIRCYGLLLEFSGAKLTTPFNAISAGATGASGAPTCGSITPTATDLIIAGTFGNSATTQTNGTGFTLAETVQPSVAAASEYNLNASAGAVTPAFGASYTSVWVGQAWSFTAGGSSVIKNGLAMMGWGT